MPISVKTKTDNVPELERFVDLLDGVSAVVGFEGEHSGAGMSNARLAYILEHGSPARNIPARPAMEPAIRENKKEIMQAAEQALRRAVKAGNIPAFMNGMQQVADVAANALKRKILENNFTPLAPATIKAKGHDQAWIDTGELFNSIKGEVQIRKRRGR